MTDMIAEALARGLGVPTKPESNSSGYGADGDTRRLREGLLREATAHGGDTDGTVSAPHRGAHAQIRAHGGATHAAILEVPATSAAPGAGADGAADGCLRVELSTPIRGVAPGQTLVLYDADRVLAAATLERRA